MAPVRDPDIFSRAIARFDAANAEDPNREIADGGEQSKALLYALRMTSMLSRFAPDASVPLRLAARSQHLQRWKVPRTSYPMTRAGYHRWRAHLRDFHADLAAGILRDVGYDDAAISRVRSLIRKEALKTDPEAQTLEDVVALVFLESHLGEFVAEHGDYPDEKFIDILAKTGKKMSARGRAAALASIALPPALAPFVREAMRRAGAGEGTSSDE
jgi:hypothetical protein